MCRQGPRLPGKQCRQGCAGMGRQEGDGKEKKSIQDGMGKRGGSFGVLGRKPRGREPLFSNMPRILPRSLHSKDCLSIIPNTPRRPMD